ncbi:MAG: Unknown protein [uncultured Sulfurovum sp.]|uniref:ABC-type transport auxiliary lipoprotein component domain-containing protein n=1 Tax=uncultured Sulfurovum sp. TaxID=269237 RepID=A0A6S6SRU8_9BACT|nr:MAG: Unknown protein [uncultured Sulfurovum sp.]
MKQLLLLSLLLLFTGCATKKFYTLGEELNIKPQTTYTQAINVVTVSIPKYLEEHKIVRQVSPYQIELLDKTYWLVPMEQKLTKILIEYLEQSMNNPNVHLYPWAGSHKSSTKVALHIKHFIASSKEVRLKANYKISHTDKRKEEVQYFETKIKSGKEVEAMMIAMEKAYLELLAQISATLIKNK